LNVNRTLGVIARTEEMDGGCVTRISAEEVGEELDMRVLSPFVSFQFLLSLSLSLKRSFKEISLS